APRPTAPDACELGAPHCRIARTGAATNRRAPARWRRSGRESRRPRVPASHRGAVLELARAPTNVLDQIGARNYFPAQPAEVREGDPQDPFRGTGAGLKKA